MVVGEKVGHKLGHNVAHFPHCLGKVKMGRTHLVQRNGRLYFRMRVPHPLWEHLPKEIKFSFKRSQIENVRKRCIVLGSQLEWLFSQALKGILNMAKLDELARQFCARALEEDSLYHLRNDENLSSADFDEAIAFYRKCLQTHRVDCMEEFIEYAKEYGKKLDPQNDPYDRIALEDYCAARIEMLRILKERHRGNLYNGYDERTPEGKLSKILSPQDAGLVPSASGYSTPTLLPSPLFLMPNGEKSPGKASPQPASERAALLSELFQSRTPDTGGTEKNITIQQLIEAYLGEKKAGGTTQRNLVRYRGRIAPLAEIFGPDRPAASITREEMVKVNTDVLLVYPKNRNKKYPGKSLKELLSMEPKPEPIEEGSRVHFMEDFHTFFNWAFACGHILRNPLTKLVKRRKKIRIVSELRPAFTMLELEKIFRDIADMPNQPRFVKKLYPYRLWIPLFGLYQGMRLNEICQLFLDDIFVQDGIPCIRIHDNPERNQHVKNQFSNRSIPMHSTLLKLGFFDYYFETLNDPQRPNDQLFPMLTYQEGYQRKMQSFNHRIHCLIKDKRKSFHSFRHNFDTELSNKEPNAFLIQCLDGHARQGELGGRYSIGQIEPMKRTLEKLDYKLDIFACLNRAPLSSDKINQQISLLASSLEIGEAELES